MATAISLLLGLGIFLFGMRYLEKSLEAIGSEGIHKWLARSTSHPLSSVASGTVITAILQSSSMVSLIVLAFASAGMIPLFNAVGVILGANLGTTFTGWIVATIGFKLDLESLALPMFGLAALYQVFTVANLKRHAVAGVFVGLGVLLFGLVQMKGAVEALPSVLTQDWLSQMNAPMFLLTGMLMTAVIQSSSAMTMIALTALNSGMIDLSAAAALVVGADIGTTSTTALGSLRGSVIAKQLALSHLIYNLTVDAFAFVVMIPLLPLGLALLGISDPLYGLVLFHSGFNLVGLFVFVPMLKRYSHWLSGFFNEEAKPVTEYLHTTSPEVPAAAEVALKKELFSLMYKVVALNLRNLKLDPARMEVQANERDQLISQFQSEQTFEEKYENIKRLEGALHQYILKMDVSKSSSSEQKLAVLAGCARDAVYSAKTLKDVRADLVRFRHASLEGESQHLEYPPELVRIYAWVIDLLGKQHKRSYIDNKIRLIRELNELAHSKLHRDILSHKQSQSSEGKASNGEESNGEESNGKNSNGEDSDLSTLLNANREIWHSNVNLIKALEGWFELNDDGDDSQ